MKISLKELRGIVEQGITDALSEAKKKKKDEDGYPIGIISSLSGSMIDPALDHSTPQGNGNRLKKQGQSGIGPWTSEQMLRTYVRQVAAAVLSGKKAK